MTNEVRKFFDQMFAFEETEEIGNVTLLQCAGTLWSWYQDGVELPSGIKDTDLYEYVQELAEKAKKAEKPVKLYRIRVRDVLTASFLVEAHDEGEAETIFDEWSGTNDGRCVVWDRLVDCSEGWEVDGMIIESELDETPDVAYNEGCAILK